MGSKGEAPRLGPLAKGAQYVRYLQGDKQVPPQVPQHRGLGVPSVPRLRQMMLDIERVLAQGDRAYALCEVENDCEAVELEALLYCYAWTKATR